MRNDEVYQISGNALSFLLRNNRYLVYNTASHRKSSGVMSSEIK